MEPLADEGVVCYSLPDTISFFVAFIPFTFVGFAGGPNVFTLAMHFSQNIIAYKSISIAKSFKAFAISFIVVPFSFVDTGIIVSYHALTLSFRVNYFSPVHRIFVLFQSKMW